MSLNTCVLHNALRQLKIGKEVVVRSRGVSTSAVLLGKRNFRKFHLGNKRGTKIFRRDRNAGLFPDIPIETEVQTTGFKYANQFHFVPEMIPEFIVPDLTGCQLKPYVSYRAGDTYQEPFTAQDLYQHVYFNKLDRDFKENMLDENGNPKNPSDEEHLTAEEAYLQARKTGSDIFSERIPRHWECLEIDVRTIVKEKAAKHGYSHFTDFLKEPLPDTFNEPRKTTPLPTVKKSQDASS